MRKCPICNWEGEQFLPGNPNFKHDISRKLESAKCPKCSSRHWHRAAWMMLEHLGLPEKNCKILHVAPEPFLTKRFDDISKEYIRIDKYRFNNKSVLEMDVTDLKFDNNHFDFIYCSHVLEHVTEDTKALQELFRVLKPGGFAFLQVPVYPIKNSVDLYEHAPDQMGHVHQPGEDYFKRYLSVGFSIRIYKPYEMFAQDTYGLRPGWDPVVLCCKHNNPLIRQFRKVQSYFPV